LHQQIKVFDRVLACSFERFNKLAIRCANRVQHKQIGIDRQPARGIDVKPEFPSHHRVATSRNFIAMSSPVSASIMNRL
jgi:hypothetical protein